MGRLHCRRSQELRTLRGLVVLQANSFLVSREMAPFYTIHMSNEHFNVSTCTHLIFVLQVFA
jgi:hypothetical protein